MPAVNCLMIPLNSMHMKLYCRPTADLQLVPFVISDFKLAHGYERQVRD